MEIEEKPNGGREHKWETIGERHSEYSPFFQFLWIDKYQNSVPDHCHSYPQQLPESPTNSACMLRMLSLHPLNPFDLLQRRTPSLGSLLVSFDYSSVVTYLYLCSDSISSIAESAESSLHCESPSPALQHEKNSIY